MDGMVRRKRGKGRQKQTHREKRERERGGGETSKDVKFNTACHVNWYKPTWVTINK